MDVEQMADIDISAISGPTYSFGTPQPTVEFVDNSSGVNLQENITLVSGTSSKSFLSGAVKSFAAMLKDIVTRVAPRHSSFPSRQESPDQRRIDIELGRIELSRQMR
ncbi:MAG: hypothetical protein E4H30_02225 [Methanomassiliicoccus sp.]|nr:MAG: hypothetical protein E4H30_02225 [Methanomassiliicoccus sp.]